MKYGIYLSAKIWVCRDEGIAFYLSQLDVLWDKTIDESSRDVFNPWIMRFCDRFRA